MFGESDHAGGTFVFRQGDDAACVHVVRTGRIELSRIINDRRVALQILRSSVGRMWPAGGSCRWPSA